MNSALTCILVHVVSTFTTRSREFTQIYQYLPNNLITDFTNLSNQMFLYVNTITAVALQYLLLLPVPVAERSKAWVCGRLLTGISGVVWCQVEVSATS
jgi:hypothetical protein